MKIDRKSCADRGPPLAAACAVPGSLVPVVEQVALQGVRQGQAQDLLPQDIHRGLRPRLHPALLFLPLLHVQPFTAGVLSRVGNPTGKHLFVQKDDGFHSTAANSPSLEPGSGLQSAPTSAHCLLVDGLLNGAPNGDASQVLEAADRQGGCGQRTGVRVWDDNTGPTTRALCDQQHRT